MKKLMILAAAVALVALFATCSLFGPKTTNDECVTNFMNDINSSDRSGVYSNLDITSSEYALAKTSAYWNTAFPTAGIPYSLTNISSGGTYTATINSGVTFVGGVAITFQMSTDATGNAVIHSITIAGLGTIFQ